MIEFNVIWILSIVIYSIAFLGIILCSKIFFKPIDTFSFSFKRIFPFEVTNNLNNSFSIFKVFLFIFTGMSFSPIFVLVAEESLFESIKFLTIFASCIFGLAAVLFSFLHFFDPSHVKPHLILVSLSFFFTVFSGLITAIISIIIFKTNFDHNLIAFPNLIFGFVSLLSTIWLIVLSFTLKLKDWGKLEQNNGALVRPKLFPLAALEWSILLTLFIEEICYFCVILQY